MFLLDTDHITILHSPRQPEYARLTQRMSQHAPTDFYFSIVSFQEQVLGANAYLNRARTDQEVIHGYDLFWQLLTAYSAVQVALFDTAAAAMFAALRSQRVRVGTMDLRIAAIALSRGMTVLTRNLSDFRRVPGLNIEDWTV